MTMLVVILIELIRSRCSRSLRIGCGQANPSIDWINASNREYEMVNGVYSQPLLIHLDHTLHANEVLIKKFLLCSLFGCGAPRTIVVCPET